MNTHVIFVAPFFMETTLRFVKRAAALPGVNLSLISQDSADKLPHDLDFYTAWPKLMIFDQFDPPPRKYSVGAAYFNRVDVF